MVEKRRKLNQTWIKNNRERYSASKYFYKDSLRLEALKHYGGGEIKCVICGFSDIRALVLDHINNDGAEHRKEWRINGRGLKGGTNIYERLKRFGFIDGLQTVCANCNMIKQQNRHLEKRLGNKFYVNNQNTTQLYSQTLPSKFFNKSGKI